MLAAASLALRDMLSRPFRAVLLKSLALTIGVLVLLWMGLEWLLAGWVALPYPWLDTGFSVLAGIALVVGLGFLIAPVTALVAGLFLDDVAEVVERTRYPGEPAGRAMPLARSMLTTLKFFGVVVLVNLLALPLVLFVGFGFVIFLAANAYLLGREYFELVALRFHDERTARALRIHNCGSIFGAGLLIALFLLVPVANMLAPLFATAIMVHMHKRTLAAARRRGGVLDARSDSAHPAG
jgi:CysZ protein